MSSWLIRRSNFPFDIPGAQLGTVEALDKPAAESLARARFKGAITVEPSHGDNSQLLERAVKSATKSARARSHGHAFSRRTAMKPRAAQPDLTSDPELA